MNASPAALSRDEIKRAALLHRRFCIAVAGYMMVHVPSILAQNHWKGYTDIMVMDGLISLSFVIKCVIALFISVFTYKLFRLLGIKYAAVCAIGLFFSPPLISWVVHYVVRWKFKKLDVPLGFLWPKAIKR